MSQKGEESNKELLVGLKMGSLNRKECKRTHGPRKQPGPKGAAVTKHTTPIHGGKKKEVRLGKLKSLHEKQVTPPWKSCTGAIGKKN